MDLERDKNQVGANQMKKQSNSRIIDDLFTYMNQVKTKQILKDKVLSLFKLFETLNVDLISVHYEDIVDEFEFVFFIPEDNDSGKIILTIREDYSKIYIYGCKFSSTNLNLNFDENIYEILRGALAGEYYITEKRYRNVVYSREVDFMNHQMIMKFGLFNFFKKNYFIANIKGINFLTK